MHVRKRFRSTRTSDHTSGVRTTINIVEDIRFPLQGDNFCWQLRVVTRWRCVAFPHVSTVRSAGDHLIVAVMSSLRRQVVLLFVVGPGLVKRQMCVIERTSCSVQCPCQALMVLSFCCNSNWSSGGRVSLRARHRSIPKNCNDQVPSNVRCASSLRERLVQSSVLVKR